MHHPTDRIAHTTAFVTPVVEHWLEQEIAHWVHSMKDQSDNPSDHERMLMEQLLKLVATGDLVGPLVILASRQEIYLEHVFRYLLTPVPLSLCYADGMMA